MNIIQKRFIAFLLLCIPVRLFAAFISKVASKKYLPFLGYIALIPAIGFLYIFIFGKRKKGGETFNQPIWWGYMRPIHSFLYFYFAYMAINKRDNAHMILFYDVILGLLSFFHYHYNANSFKHLY